MQKVVTPERQGRVFGFAQSVEQAASPITAFLIGPVAQLVFIPFMTTGSGVDLIGGWFGTGTDRGLALLFTVAGLAGLNAVCNALELVPRVVTTLPGQRARARLCLCVTVGRMNCRSTVM